MDRSREGDARKERDGMRVKQDSVLRLLIVDDSVEAAEAIVSGLRNAGIAVRVTRPENEEAELPALIGGALDLVVAAQRRQDAEPRRRDAGGRCQRQGHPGR